MQKKILIQSIPNFSEGRDLKKVEHIVDAFRGISGLRLLDYSSDPDHNRSVAVVVATGGEHGSHAAAHESGQKDIT